MTTLRTLLLLLVVVEPQQLLAHIFPPGSRMSTDWAEWQHHCRFVLVGDTVTSRASNEGYPKVPKDFTITEKAPTRAWGLLLVESSYYHFNI